MNCRLSFNRDNYTQIKNAKFSVLRHWLGNLTNKSPSRGFRLHGSGQH